MATAPVQGIQPGSLKADVLQQKVLGELRKVKEFEGQIGNPSLSIKKLPDKAQRKQLEVSAGSNFNIAGKQSELIEISRQLLAAVKAAGRDLAKNTKAVFTAKAEILKRIGEVELDIASGSYSIEASFKRSKRADTIIQQALKIAESGGLEDKATALEFVQTLKEFQNVPTVALALAKNAAKIAKLETESQNPALLPFLSAAAGGGKAAKGLAEKYNPADLLGGKKHAA